MHSGSENLNLARRYLEAIEAGATGNELAGFFAPEVVQEEGRGHRDPSWRSDDTNASMWRIVASGSSMWT